MNKSEFLERFRQLVQERNRAFLAGDVNTADDLHVHIRRAYFDKEHFRVKYAQLDAIEWEQCNANN